MKNSPTARFFFSRLLCLEWLLLSAGLISGVFYFLHPDCGTGIRVAIIFIAPFVSAAYVILGMYLQGRLEAVDAGIHGYCFLQFNDSTRALAFFLWPISWPLLFTYSFLASILFLLVDIGRDIPKNWESIFRHLTKHWDYAKKEAAEEALREVERKRIVSQNTENYLAKLDAQLEVARAEHRLSKKNLDRQVMELFLPTLRKRSRDGETRETEHPEA